MKLTIQAPPDMTAERFVEASDAALTYLRWLVTHEGMQDFIEETFEDFTVTLHPKGVPGQELFVDEGCECLFTASNDFSETFFTHPDRPGLLFGNEENWKNPGAGIPWVPEGN